MGDERVRPDAVNSVAARNKARAKYPFPHYKNHFDRNHRRISIDDALSGKDIFPGGSLAKDKPNINCRCTGEWTT